MWGTIQNYPNRCELKRGGGGRRRTVFLSKPLRSAQLYLEMATVALVALSALALASGNVLSDVALVSANALSGVALASEKVLSVNKLMRRRLQEVQPFQFYIDRLYEKTDTAPALPSMNFPGGNNDVSRPESAYPDPLSRRTQLLFDHPHHEHEATITSSLLCPVLVPTARVQPPSALSSLPPTACS